MFALVYQARAKRIGHSMAQEQSNQRPPTPPATVPRSLSARLSLWLLRQQVLMTYRYNDLAALCFRGINSLKLRGFLPTVRIAIKRAFPVPRQHYPLRLYRDAVEPGTVRFPHLASATASIVIPVYGQLGLTLRCLHSLACSGDTTVFEVIVVDDASPDDSGAVLAQIDGLVYQRNASNLGFIGSCNAGAAMARGRFVVFLNNDTLVQPGWLDALLSTFDAFPDTGLVGSKLVFPDGRLQEAGGIVYRSGNAANYGRNADPTEPRFNFVRETDYCSGASIAIPTAVFHRLGGFDSHYAPAYFEDTDLGMRVRESGLKVRYQPASVVVHLEGASSGTDTRTGVKAYQVLNQKKFRERWASCLAKHAADPDRSDVDDAAAIQAATHRSTRRVLVIDSYTPTPDRDSGSVRMVGLLSLLVEEGCSVVFMGQNLSHDGPYTEALQQLGIEVWWQPWARYLPHWLAPHGKKFDAIIVSRHYVLMPLLPMLRELAPQAQIVFDTVDLHFLREQREAEQSDNHSAHSTAQRTKGLELGLIRKSDLTWVVSEVERELLRPLAPQARVEIVSNIHSISDDTPGFDSRSDLVFVGSFRHPPNVDAARWLALEIFPRVRAAMPAVRLLLVGADADASVLQLDAIEGVQVCGHVPDLDALLDVSRISLAPLRYGAGIKGKVNHSLSRGLPMVATRCAAEGMFLVDQQDILIADSAADFAQAIVRLYGDRELWQRLRAGGLENTRRHFSREAARSSLRTWLDALPAKPAPAGA